MEYLDEEKVRSLLTYEALIPAVERALIDLSAGRIQQPVRSILRVPEHEGIFALMPAVDGELMGVKLVTFYEENVAQPTHQAVIQLLSAVTGEPLVAMDGRLITEMRTAAVSAVATRLLAREDARVLAILGSGVQARSHARALRMVRSFDEIRAGAPRSDYFRGRQRTGQRDFAPRLGLLNHVHVEAWAHHKLGPGFDGGGALRAIRHGSRPQQQLAAIDTFQLL